jgi:hypothetical protein
MWHWGTHWGGVCTAVRCDLRRCELDDGWHRVLTTCTRWSGCTAGVDAVFGTFLERVLTFRVRNVPVTWATQGAVPHLPLSLGVPGSDGASALSVATWGPRCERDCTRGWSGHGNNNNNDVPPNLIVTASPAGAQAMATRGAARAVVLHGSWSASAWPQPMRFAAFCSGAACSSTFSKDLRRAARCCTSSGTVLRSA